MNCGEVTQVPSIITREERVKMVQKYKSPIRAYKYPFELVMAAYERRFPTCDMIPVLVSTDIIKEEISDDESLHIIERRCKLNVDAPYLLKKVAGVEYFYCIQRNTLDRRARTLQIEAWNESFAKKIVINEYCRYFVHPENSYWTCFEQTASLEVKSFFGFESAVEKLAVKLYAQSIEKGKEIIEMHVTQLKSEGITYVPLFGSVNGDGDGDGEVATADAPINGSIVARDGHASDIVGNEDDTTSNKTHQNSRQNSAKHKNSHHSTHKHKLNSSPTNESSDSRSEKSSKFNSKSSSPSSSSVGQVIQGNNNSNHCMPSSSMVATSSSSLESTITTSSFSSSTITVANSSGAEDSSSLNNGLAEDFMVTTTSMVTRTEYYSS